MTADEILAIPADRPEHLFTYGTAEALKAECQALRSRWHPDHAGGNDAVMAHINVLYAAAEKRLADGIWRAHNVLTLRAKNGSVYKTTYKIARPFELGTVYIGRAIVAYHVRREFSDLVDNAQRLLEHMKFASDEMRKEVSRYLPTVIDRLELQDGMLLVLRKESDHLCLRDVLAHCGRMDPKHVAWIVSRLHNICCYLEWAGIAHCDISLDTYFISPQNHVGSLVGGWWYATRFGSRLKALPQRTLSQLPGHVLTDKTALAGIDLELLRATARELLGDISGSSLLRRSDVPAPMTQWIRGATIGSAIEEYQRWYDDIILKSFGPRKFVVLNVAESDIYKE